MQNNKCEYKQCRKLFEVDYKHRNQRFCCRKCMYEWRKEKNWATSNCENCKTEFKHRKIEKRRFCSENCMRTSDWKRELTRQQWLENNPMNNSENVKKIIGKLKGRNIGFGSNNDKHTKKSKNKMSKLAKTRYKENKKEILTKRDETYIRKYGMTCGEYFKIKGDEYAESLGVKNVFQLPEIKVKARNRISKGQRLLYEQIKKKHKDVILEHWLSDVKRSVDIFISSENKVIEYYGKYWHCHPNNYNADYYHKVIKMTAEEIWKRDGNRERELLDAGYELEIIWEK